jgi:hypothetical protein
MPIDIPVLPEEEDLDDETRPRWKKKDNTTFKAPIVYKPLTVEDLQVHIGSTLTGAGHLPRPELPSMNDALAGILGETVWKAHIEVARSLEPNAVYTEEELDWGSVDDEGKATSISIGLIVYQKLFELGSLVKESSEKKSAVSTEFWEGYKRDPT